MPAKWPCLCALIIHKVVKTTLCSQGHLSVGYIDDSYLQGDAIKN